MRAKKRTLSTAESEVERTNKVAKLGNMESRSPLKTIQLASRRRRDLIRRKSSLLQNVSGCGGHGGTATNIQPRSERDHSLRVVSTWRQHRCLVVAPSASHRHKTAQASIDTNSGTAEPTTGTPLKHKQKTVVAEDSQSASASTAANPASTVVQSPPAAPVKQPAAPAVSTGVSRPPPQDTGELEYIDDVLATLLHVEYQQRLPRHFIAKQANVTWVERCVVVDWLVMVQHYLRMQSGTLHLAAGLLDATLSAGHCSLDELQLVGVVALWLAAKLEERVVPAATQLLALTQDGYTSAALLRMERLVMNRLHMRLLRVEPVQLVRLLLRRLHLSHTRQQPKYEHTCVFLLDVAQCQLGGEYRRPALLAAAAVFTAELLLVGDGAHLLPALTGCVATTVAHLHTVSAEMLQALAGLRHSQLRAPLVKFNSSTRYGRLSSCVELSEPHVRQVMLRHAVTQLRHVTASSDAENGTTSAQSMSQEHLRCDENIESFEEPIAIHASRTSGKRHVSRQPSADESPIY